MKRKTYTTKDLFDIVMAELRARDQVPDILDYALAAWNPKPLLDYGFDVLGCVNYGGSEGIYIDLFYSGDIGNGVEKGEIGTIKTLSRSDEAFLAMAELMARFQIEATRFINKNLVDFAHVGYDARFYFNGEEKFHYGFTDKRSKSLDEAKKDAYHYLRMAEPYNYDYVIITENATGKEITVKRADVPEED